ncbi:MAG: SdrD B-like domain-containing protein [Pseudomonadota bacterium]
MERLTRALGLGLAALASSATFAFAQISIEPAKSFDPTAIGPGKQSTLSVTITNDNAFAVTSVAFSETAPTGLTYVGVSPVSNTCGGTVTLSATQFSLSGATIPASTVSTQGSCTVEVLTTTNLPLSAGTLNFVSTLPVGSVTADNAPASATAASATLTSTVINMTGDKVIVAPGGGNPNVAGGDTDKYFEITLNNPNNYDLTGVGLVDELDRRFRVLASAAPTGPLAPIAPLSTTCGSGTVTSTLTGNDETVTFSGGTVPANGSCVVRIFVEPESNLSTYTFTLNRPNVIGAGSVTSNEGATNEDEFRSFNVDVWTGGLYEKQFSPQTIGLTNTSRLTITIRNLNNLSATGIEWADFLPTGMVAVSDTLTTNGQCGSPIQDNSDLTQAAVTNLTLAPQARCRLSFDVAGTTTGSFLNEVGGTGFPAIEYDDGRTSNFRATDDTLRVGNTGGLALEKLAKAEYQSSYQANIPGNVEGRVGGIFNFRIEMRNGTASSIGNINLVDDIATAMAGRFELIGSSVAFNGTGCTTTSLTGNEATDIVTLVGGTVPAGATCRLDFDVMATGDTNARQRNTVLASDISVDGTVYPFDLVSRNIRADALLQPRKSFSPTTVGAGGVSRLTVDITALGDRSFTVSEINFTDDLPSPLVIAADPNPVSTCGGIFTGATPGSDSFTFSGGELGSPSNPFSFVGNVCSVSVNVMAGTGTSNATNTIPVVQARRLDSLPGDLTENVFSAASDSATLSWTQVDAAVSKAFNPTVVGAGDPSQLSITFSNPSSSALSRIALTDTFPTGMTIAQVPNVSFNAIGGATCTPGSITATPLANNVAISGASVSAGGTCELLVDVISSTRGNLTNTIAANALVTAEGVSNPSPASASLQVSPSVVITKAFTPATIEVNGVSTVEISIANANAAAFDFNSPGLTDALPTGVVIASTPNISAECGISVVAAAGATDIVMNGGTVPADSTCTIAVDVTSSATGDYTNLVPSGALSTVQGATNNSEATANLTVIISPVANDDSDLDNTFGSAVALSILGNDTDPDGALDANSVSLTAPADAQSVFTDTDGDVTGFTVPDEGVWSYASGTGELTFTPQDGFIGNPTPITYRVNDTDGNPSNLGTVTVTYQISEPVAADDTSSGNTPGDAVTLDVLTNDTDTDGTIDPATVSLITPLGATGVLSDAAGDVTGFTIPDEGDWSVDPTTGEITFTPEADFTTDPTPVDYVVDDNVGLTSNQATVTIDYDLPTFSCSGAFYEVISGQLSQLDTSTGNYTPIGSANPDYNATGYNVLDNYIYGIGREAPYNRELLRVGANGEVEPLGFIVPGNPAQGDMDGANTLYFSPTATQLRTINVLTGAQGTVNFTGNALGVVYDMSFLQVGGQSLMIGAGRGTLRRWNLTTLEADNVAVAGLPNQDFGASWSDLFGNLYVASNTDGTVYAIANPAGDNPIITSTFSAARSSNHDAMSCRNAPPPFAGTLTPVAQDDSSTGNALGDAVTLDAVANDFDPDGNVDPTTVSLATPSGATGEVTDASGDVIGFTVPGEGAWAVDETTGAITFTPDPAYTGDPTPITYTIDDNDNLTSNSATVSVSYAETPGIAVLKSADTSGLSAAPLDGETIIYSYTVTNPGNVALDLGPEPLVDTITYGTDGSGAAAALDAAPAFDAAASNDANGNGRLDPGDSFVYIADFTVNQTAIDAGGVHNTASVTGNPVDASGNDLPGLTDPVDTSDNDLTGDGTDGTADSNGNNPTVVSLAGSGSIELVKSVSSVSDTNSSGVFGDVGDTVNFTFTVENTGNLALAGISVSDPSLSALTGTATLTQPAAGFDGDLAAGEGPVVAATATYVLSDTDISAGTVTNTASVTSTAVATTAGGDPDPSSPIAGAAPVTDTSDAGSTPDLDASDGSVPSIADPGTTDSDGVAGNDSDEPTLLDLPAAFTISGTVFLDINGDGTLDGGDDTTAGAGYNANLYDADGNVVATTIAAADGAYSFSGMAAGDYRVGFVSPGGLGVGLTDAVTVSLATPTQTDVNQPIDPQGVFYDSVAGSPIAGVRVELTDAGGTTLPAACVLPGQQSQITGADGTYRFDIITGADAACPVSETEYQILVVSTPSTYFGTPSTNIPPETGPVQVTGCPFDAVPGGSCQLSASTSAPLPSAPTPYYYGFLIEAGDPDVINNHIPLDPSLAAAPPTTDILITKRHDLADGAVIIGETVPYTITVENLTSFGAGTLNVVDELPIGLTYVPGTGVVDGTTAEPTINGQTLAFSGVTVTLGTTIDITLSARVGANAPTGDLTNTAYVTDSASSIVSNRATATITRQPEAVFDCTDVIGKVFDDRNANGRQDNVRDPSITDQRFDKFPRVGPDRIEGEPGIPGARLVTANGTWITTDQYGRYHIPCAALPDSEGANFILKLDTRSLPTGYRLTTENPRVLRITSGKVTRMNFGVSFSRVFDVDLTETAFIGNAMSNRLEAGMARLLRSMEDRPSHLKVTYFERGENRRLVNRRLDAVEDFVRKNWRQNGRYKLTIERTIRRLQ